jgi:hypothetical protein
MLKSKLFVWLALTAAAALPGAASLAAQERYYGPDAYGARADLHADYRDVSHDWDRVARLRADLARDERRREEAIWRGHYREAERISRDIARDRARLAAQYRDIRHDRNDISRDRRNLSNGYGYR